jgi:hypothetical protein
MFGDLTVLQAFVGYFLSGIVFGILFFLGKTLINRPNLCYQVVGIVMVLVSLFFAMLTLLLLTLVFVKAFWWAAVGLAALIVVLWRIGK